MIYALKLLMVALTVAFAASMVARPAFRDLLVGKPYRRAWQVVFLAVVVSYLSYAPAVFLVGTGVVGFIAFKTFGGDMRARIAAFMMLLIVFPPVSLSVEGVAGINRLLAMDHMRVLSLVLLMPAAATLLFRDRKGENNHYRAVDLFYFGYQLFQLSQASAHSSFTGVLRLAVESFLSAVLPYYVITRGLKTVADLRYVGVHFMVGCVFVASIAAAEIAIQRNLFTPLQYVYGVIWQQTHTLMRGGLIRVQSTTSQPLLLAYLLLTGLGVWTWLSGWHWRRPSTLSVFMLLLVALAGTFSRGPWLGAALFFLSTLALRWMPRRLYALMLVGLVAAAVGIKMAGADEAVMEALKTLFGSSKDDIGSIEYRKLLLDTALALIKQSPVWGVPNYLAYMENLRQGEGIIDLVNTYLIVTLNGGLVGLTVFVMPQVIVLARMIRQMGLTSAAGFPNDFLKAFTSLLVAGSAVLLTTSSFGPVPYLMTFTLAAALAYMRIEPAQRGVDAQQPVASDITLTPRPGLALGGLAPK